MNEKHTKGNILIKIKKKAQMIQKETKQKREKRKALDEDVRTKIEKKNQKKKNQMKNENYIMKRQNLTRKKTSEIK